MGQRACESRSVPCKWLVIAGMAIVGCGRDSVAPHSDPVLSSRSAPAWFADVTADRGLPVKTEPWSDGHFMVPEITAGGLALFDYDGDGDLDIYQVCHPAPGPWEKSLATPAPNRLYEQQSDGRFQDVSAKSGLADPGYGHGVAIGDVDNDGDLDVYVANIGRDAFYLNNGDRTFTVATANAGFIGGSHWSSSCGFFDCDRDGDLDLFVVRFARFEPGRKCFDEADKPEYCNPQSFYGENDVLYRNNGDGTFTDVTRAAGIADQSRGWGLLFVDANHDGWPDIFVANDGEANQLWINRNGGVFVEEAFTRGVALNGAGVAEGNMGAAAGDIANAGKWDLFVTHLRGEKNTLFAATRPGVYQDRSATANLAVDSLPYTGWGCGFCDFDHDGDLDLAVVNGRVKGHRPDPAARLGVFWNSYAETNLLFENDGKGKFKRARDHGGGFVREPRISHALAFGDLDNDGDVDLVADAADNSLRVYRNDAPRAGTHWLIVRPMVGRLVAHGAVVTLTLPSGRQLHRVAHPTYSYVSSNDPRAHFGLGADDHFAGITIRWPDGRSESFAGGKADRMIVIQQGSGNSVAP
jgi:hypothetical protein